jgi:hypothetical protein
VAQFDAGSLSVCVSSKIGVPKDEANVGIAGRGGVLRDLGHELVILRLQSCVLTLQYIKAELSSSGQECRLDDVGSHSSQKLVPILCATVRA